MSVEMSAKLSSIMRRELGDCEDLDPVGGKWAVFEGVGDFCDTHVVPLNDLKRHDMSEKCWCCPEESCDEYPGMIYTHHALDKRELYERKH